MNTRIERGMGLDVQLIICRKFCVNNNMGIRSGYTEEGVSGASLDRPALDQTQSLLK